MSGRVTLVLDITTGSWSRWETQTLGTIWLLQDGEFWLDYKGEGANPKFLSIGADFTTNALYFIDPTATSDQLQNGEEYAIRRVVTGALPVRERNFIRQFDFRIYASVGAPTEANVGVQLRTSDDNGNSWVTHAPVTMSLGDFEQELVWRSLGVIRSTKRIFEIEDTGGLMRISDASASLDGGHR